MFFHFIIVLLASNAINAGHHGFRTPALALRSAQKPITRTSQIQQIPETQPILQNIETPAIGLRSPLAAPLDAPLAAPLATPVVTTFFQIPQSIPEHLITLRVNDFVIPESIPKHLLSLKPSAPIPLTVPIPMTQPLAQPMPVLLSPAQKGRSQSSPIAPQTPIGAQTPVETRIDSNSNVATNTQNRENFGFSTPTKPLNFAPNLPEVQKPQQIGEQPIGQSVQTSQTTETQQRIDTNVGQQEEQQVIDSEPMVQPLAQNRAQLPSTGVQTPVMQTRFNAPSKGLSSYSF